MNISLVGPVYPYRGGISQHTTRLGLALATAGHKVQVLTFDRQYPGWLYPGRDDKDPSHCGMKLAAEALLEPFSIKTWAKSATSMTASQPDLVILQYWTPFWAPAFTFLADQMRKKAVPIVFMVHNVLPHERLPFDRNLACLCLGKGQAFITHSQRETERLQCLLGSRIKVVCQPHPLYDDFRREDRLTARTKLGYKPDDFLLLFFGLVRPYKGLDVLIQALGILQHSHPQIKLLAAGEFWQKQGTFDKQIKRLGLEKVVRLENRYVPQEEIARLFSAADLFVAPYIEGTQSGAVRLAMSFGLPILATEKALEPGECDYAHLKIVPSGNAAALAEGIQVFACSPATVRLEQPAHSSGWDRLVQAIELLALGARNWPA
ncbi:MAG: glycosyltransferase [Anaerolineaceae bacterium]|nr:glycosyltransferase [Anaerolineaceae bacterium]